MRESTIMVAVPICDFALHHLAGDCQNVGAGVVEQVARQRHVCHGGMEQRCFLLRCRQIYQRSICHGLGVVGHRRGHAEQRPVLVELLAAGRWDRTPASVCCNWGRRHRRYPSGAMWWRPCGGSCRDHSSRSLFPPLAGTGLSVSLRRSFHSHCRPLASTPQCDGGNHEGSRFPRAAPAAHDRERGTRAAEASRGTGAHRICRPLPLRPAFHGRPVSVPHPLRARPRGGRRDRGGRRRRDLRQTRRSCDHLPVGVLRRMRAMHDRPSESVRKHRGEAAAGCGASSYLEGRGAEPGDEPVRLRREDAGA